MMDLHDDPHPRWWEKRVDFALLLFCVLLAAEAVFVAPLFSDAAFLLRQARAQAEGAVPCRDIYCEYTPLATTALALVGGQPVASMALLQVAIFGCALFTFRMARTLGIPRRSARRMALVTWALILANEGRAIEIEPFTLLCLLGAVNSFASSTSPGASFRSGLWVGLGLWTKQYALLGWAALLVEALWGRRIAAAAALTAGTGLTVLAGALGLVLLGTQPAQLWPLVGQSAYPPSPLAESLFTAPDLLGLLVLTWATLTRSELASPDRIDRRLPFLMSAAALLPFYFRGYRHYWHLEIPFLIVILLSPLGPPNPSRGLSTRSGAVALIVLSLALDTGRCIRDLATGARRQQQSEAATLASLASPPGQVLFLVDPALLAWVDTPFVAPRTVGPKYTRISRREAEAWLSAARVVVWDRSHAGFDLPLRKLSVDSVAELERRGFVPAKVVGSLHVYTREK